MLKVGQEVIRVPKTIGVPAERGTKLITKPMKGTVVFVHSKGRFHRVEFTNALGVKMYETFDGVED